MSRNDDVCAFLRDRKGSISILAAGLLVVVIFIAFGIVDYVSLVIQKRDVQAAADHAALAAAHELVLLSEDKSDRVHSVASTFLASNYDRPVRATTEILENGKAVRVVVSTSPRVFFPGPISSGAGQVEAEAIAEVAGEGSNVCVIALHATSAKTLSLDSNSSLVAPKCAIYSNSKHSRGLSSLSNAMLQGSFICTAGGKAGGTNGYAPEPVTDCPQLANPLALRSPPAVGSCDFNDLEKDDYVGKLGPGVYCGGLTIKGNSNVTLTPGVYVMKDGQFLVDSNAKVKGDHVGFFFTGANATLTFNSNVVIRLSAPKTGAMAGLLFFEDTTSPIGREFRITSNYANYLVGTVYLPSGTFLVDANNDVADESEFTVLVVNKLVLKAGPRLVLNTNYGLSDVPIPAGVGPTTQGNGVRLTR